MHNDISIQKAEAEYKKIKDTMCPAIENVMVRFNAIGFKHLIRKEKRRTPSEQIGRFKLIKYAPVIIGDPDVSVTYRQNIRADGRIVRYWGLNKAIEDKRLRVVIRQVGNGLKHFYSIMEHTSKNPA